MSLGKAAFIAALVPVVGAIFLVSASGRFASNGPALTLALLAGGAAWLAAVFLARRGFGELKVVVAGSIALRLLAFASEPELSDDVYRYVWEGEVVLEGASPYAFSPDDRRVPEIAALTQEFPELRARVNHPDVRAAYPPLSQALGAGTAALCRTLELAPEKDGVRILRAIYGLCDLLVLWPLVVLLRRARLPPSVSVVWGWCPLPVIEFSGSGHLDSLAILLLLGALAQPRRTITAAVLWSGGILTKYLPLVGLPWFLRGPGGARRVVVAALLTVLGFLPLLFLRGAEVGFASGLSEYARRWEATSLLHGWIQGALEGFFRRDESLTDPRYLSRGIAAVAWLAYAVTVARRVSDPVAGCGRLIGAWIVLSPTLHPWYLAWMLPFLAFRPSAAWGWLALAAPLLYWPIARWQAQGIWSEPEWLWPAVALPFFALLVLESFRSNRPPPSRAAPLP
ncbi:MAG: hypothetical protein ACKVXR_16640 [Planctomycetota bacterium]